MEYIYAALLLHSAKKEINEENVKKILNAVGIETDEARIKSLVESLKNINIDEVLNSVTTLPTSTITVTQQPQEAKKEEKKEEKKEKVSEEQAVAGLAALFGL